MNVTFLSSTATFNGLLYNFKKVEAGTAKLVHTQNMSGLKHLEQPLKSDYLSYLKAWSERNSRVKNPQFHVAISVRGREKSEGELLSIAREWMDKMGYKNTPSLFFFHHDTDNNHIHIVSSRIGLDGKKISDSNEIRRAVAHLREMNKFEMRLHAEKDRLNALGYLVSTRAQLSSILSQMRYKMKIENEDLVMYKGKEKVGVIEKSVLDEVLKKVDINPFRAEQIRNEIARGRAAGLSLSAMRGVLKHSLNIDLVFYGKKGAPYGWSIIDHEWRSVYKGNEILPLKEVVDESRKILNDHERRKAVLEQAHISLLLNPRLTSSEFRSIVKAYDSYLKKGELMYKKYSLGSVGEELQDRLKYNDRLAQASRIIPKRRGELEAMSRFFNVEVEDLYQSIRERLENRLGGEGQRVPERAQEKPFGEIYKDSLSAVDSKEFLKSHNLVQLNQGREVYLMDIEGGRIDLVDIRDSYGKENSRLEEEKIVDSVEELIEEFLPTQMYDNDRGSSVDNSLKKKKRR